MPIVAEDCSPTVAGCEFRLWWDVPDGCWLRSQGRTRVLLIDDQYTSRQRLLDVREDAPLSPDELRLRRWLNADLQFLPMPEDYRWTGAFPQGSFSVSWFDAALDRVLDDSRPIAAVLLDLLYGSETRVQDASGRRFLAQLRHRLPGVPVLILSNIVETPEVDGILKRGDDATGETSFQDYLPKVDPPNRRTLLQRITEKLIEWGEVSDPDLSAFSAPMRRLARQMRKIVLYPEEISYEQKTGQFPKPVVVTGDFGSGKNYVATQLQAMSSRRQAPFETVDFSGLDAEKAKIRLFGTGPYTGAPQIFEVRMSDGAVIRSIAARGDERGMVYLAAIGVVHHADIAGQPLGREQRPLRGSVLLDEIGIAPEEVQGPLSVVLNNGRFAPNFVNLQIPTQRTIDVWFLVTLSPEGQERLRPDLAMRLAKGYRLDVPPLRDRREDVVALALRIAQADHMVSPQQVFTDGALLRLEQLASSMQVRTLEALIGKLGEVTAKRPYSEQDLDSAVASGVLKTWRRVPPADERLAEMQRRLKEAQDQPADAEEKTLAQRKTVVAELQEHIGRSAGADDLTILARWRSGVGASYPLDPRNPVALRGRGRDVIGGATAAVLSYLELCATVTATTGQYSAARIWNFFAGVQGTKSPDARTRIAPLFLIDEDTSLDALRRSDALLWLALDVAGRRSEVGKLVDRLELEKGQADRVSAMRARRVHAKPVQEE